MSESPPAGVELQSQQILETIRQLERRILARFPGSGLGRVSTQLAHLAAETEAGIERLRKPLWMPRLGAALGIVGILIVTEEIVRMGMPGSLGVGNVSEFLQASEAAVNLLILLSIGIFFMISLEARFRRRAALASLYRLRSIIHIVDMHQLTKDPEFVLTPGMATDASPRRALTRFELSRYLDYCSEMFSLTSKVAALYAQHLQDAVVLAAVNDIESLAASLSHKIWQKIMILDALSPAAESDRGTPGLNRVRT